MLFPIMPCLTLFKVSTCIRVSCSNNIPSDNKRYILLIIDSLFPSDSLSHSFNKYMRELMNSRL